MDTIFKSEDGRLFRLPPGQPTVEGDFHLLSTDGVYISTTEAAVRQLACSREDALQYLERQWRTSIETAKNAWLALYDFSVQNGMTDEIGRQMGEFETLFDHIGWQEVQAGIQRDYAGKEVDLDELLEEDSSKLVETVVQKLPDLMPFFSEENLKKVQIDPEAWADEVYKKAYGDLEKRREQEIQNDMARDIRASIARRMPKF